MTGYDGSFRDLAPPPGGTKVGWFTDVTLEGGGTVGRGGGVGEEGEERGGEEEDCFFVRGRVWLKVLAEDECGEDFPTPSFCPESTLDLRPPFLDNKKEGVESCCDGNGPKQWSIDWLRPREEDCPEKDNAGSPVT